MVKTNEVKNKSAVKKGSSTAAELRAQVAKAQEEVIAMRLENQQRKLKNTSSLRIKRDEIARLLTALRQVEMEIII